MRTKERSVLLIGHLGHFPLFQHKGLNAVTTQNEFLLKVSGASAVYAEGVDL